MVEESHAARLHRHVKEVRRDIEERGIPIDRDINRALRVMLFAGRKAIDEDKEPTESQDYLDAARRLHKLVRDKQKKLPGAKPLPLLSYNRFPSKRRKVENLNLRMKKRKKLPKGLARLVNLANTKAKSQHEFEYFLKEIEWLLR